MGPNTGDILQEFDAAMKCGLTNQQLDATVGIHPGSAQVSIPFFTLFHKNSCVLMAIKTQNGYMLLLTPIDFFTGNDINSLSPPWCAVTLCFQVLCWQVSFEIFPPIFAQSLNKLCCLGSMPEQQIQMSFLFWNTACLNYSWTVAHCPTLWRLTPQYMSRLIHDIFES